MRGKKVISLMLILTMCISLSFPSYATELKKAHKETEEAKKKVEEATEKVDDAKEKAEELEKQKEEAEQAKTELSKKLDSVLEEVAKIKKKIDAKMVEIEAKEDELIAAQQEENDQYETMKIRIKYMYETGNSQFLEVILESEDFADFVNHVEYFSMISDYDREMLQKFKDVVDKVQAEEDVLQEEYAEIESMQDELVAKQNEVQTMLDNKTAEVDSLLDEISANEEELAKLEEAKEAAEEVQRKKAEAEQAKLAAASSGAGSSVLSGSGIFTDPCPGRTRISSGFGPRTAPKAGASTYHKGLDMAAPTGTPIYAADSGTVVSAGYSGNAGNRVVISHGNGLQTVYMHCSKIYVSAGQKVSRGQNIAAVGSTGNSTGPHLHFGVMVNGNYVNPTSYL